MNVLVYEGPGVSRMSLAHTLSSLRSLLSPNYAVQTVSSDALISQPWSKSCALLVIPGGRDCPYVSHLSPAVSAIKEYVSSGGSFLGICAGAYFASAQIEWEMGTTLEVSGQRPLGFFNGICKGSVYPGFTYDSESGAHAIDISVEGFQPSIIRGLYFNGGGEFMNVHSSPLASVLATYAEVGAPEKIAAVHCKFGMGSVVLWSVHIEFSLLKEPLVVALAKRSVVLSPVQVSANETHRWQLLRHTLSLLSLSTPFTFRQIPNPEIPISPLPQLLTSAIPSLPLDVYETVKKISNTSEPLTLEDASDTFIFHQSHIADSLIQDARENPIQPSSPKTIIVFEHGSLPPSDMTPKFQIEEYYSFLAAERAFCSNSASFSFQSLGFGQLLIYGEAVTSTQTMLDKNPILIRAFPTPLLSLATYQLLGRGRGGNVWVSPDGCLQFSLLLRAPLSQLPGSRLVFIQYLFGIAVIEACKRLLGPAGEKVRLKWPNDIYAVLDVFDEYGRKNGEELKKLGGILVTTNFSGNEVDIVIGCGLNVLNKNPTISLSQLFNKGELRLEKVTACIMVSFETLWTQFLTERGSFAPFLETYLSYWLHSDQLVTLSTVTPPIPVRVVGITLDFGLLRTIPDDNLTGGFIDLQPDGNSFDMMVGLIKRKT